MIGILRKNALFVAILVLMVAFFVWWTGSRNMNDEAVMLEIPEYEGIDQRSILDTGFVSAHMEPPYSSYISEWTKKGARNTEAVQIVIPGTGYARASAEGVSRKSGIGDLPGEAVVLEGENNWLEYEISVEQEGFYQMDMTYYALKGKGEPLLRSVMIDGEFPFHQIKRMKFSRMWNEAERPWVDLLGNEFNSRQVEVFGWQTREFRDPDEKTAEPFRFYFSKGNHTIRIQAIREPSAISKLRIYSPVLLPTYQQKLEEYKQKGYKDAKNRLITVQAEETKLTSDPTLLRSSDGDPATVPFDKNAILLNTFGGLPWRTGGQWAEWEFEAPESGLYQIGVRYATWFMNEVPIQRAIYIDGEIPFQEMGSVKFAHTDQWDITSLGKKEEPYLFYLEKGTHRIRMEVRLAGLGDAFELIQEVVRKISFFTREVILVTGTNPDPNRIWELERNITNLVPRLHLMAKDLDNVLSMLTDYGINPKSPELNTLKMARNQLIDMADKPDTIPSRLTALMDSQSSLGTYISMMSDQSMIFDYVIVKSPDSPWPNGQSSTWAKLGVAAYQFFASFSKDYNAIGSTGSGERSIDVWVMRGREWAQLIKKMADEDFTPATGIRVKINVVPAGAKETLMLSSSAGLAPDVALGVDGEVPIDFALRNALVDLTKFPDYPEIESRFRPGAITPFKYQGGVYALPETQDFKMLFYRKDILQQLGIMEVPQTWREVMDLIPILQQNGMDFFYSYTVNNAIKQFTPFLFQNGGEFYRDGGTRSNLDTPEALKAIKMWTGLYTDYKISKEANFYNRFRSGEMPIGVDDYFTYVQLSAAAPELLGWWEMSPLPGVEREDGSIDRSTGGLAETSMIFSQSQRQEDAWEFIKWWSSTPVQIQFGDDLEALIGAEARWNTSNVEALSNMSWPEADVKAILEQWDWFKEREIVPGGYYTNRHIVNIWNEVVLDGRSSREALEDGVKEINKEIRKKREEFGLKDEHAAVAEKGGGGN